MPVMFLMLFPVGLTVVGFFDSGKKIDDAQPLERSHWAFSEIMDRASKYGVNVSQIFVSVGSNASWSPTGFRSGKLEVGQNLFDDRAALRGTVMHELGHARQFCQADVVALSLSVMLLGVVSLTNIWNGILFAAVLAPAFVVVQAWWCRRKEFAADSFAASHGAAEELIKSFTFSPHSGSIFATHPPMDVRVARIYAVQAAAS